MFERIPNASLNSFFFKQKLHTKIDGYLFLYLDPLEFPVYGSVLINIFFIQCWDKFTYKFRKEKQNVVREGRCVQNVLQKKVIKADCAKKFLPFAPRTFQVVVLK